VQKNSFSWGIDSIFITFTYTLPSITPYPINGYFQTGYHALISKPVTINPYSTKSIETVNLQVPPPGTRIAPVSNIRPFGQIAQESLGRHRINPGNVNITNFPIVTLEKLGFNRITSLVNLQDRSIKSLETLGLHRLYAQSFVNPYSVNTSEQFGFDTLYSQAFIQPYGIKTLDILGRNTLYSQAFIIPYPINTVEKTGLHRLNSEAFIRPYPITTEEKLRLHSLLYGSYIYPYSITTTEILGLHELQRQVRTLSFLNEVHYPSYEMGYFDCVAISRDINNDPYYDMSFGSLNTDYMFSINNMNLNYKQNSNFEKRLAGEGASPTTFKIDKRDYSFDFTMPIKIESWGDVDPGFAALYDYCIQGYKGSTNNFVGRILSDNMNSAIGSTNRFVIDNISDFMSLGTG
jgi:ribosomal protein L30/L7E